MIYNQNVLAIIPARGGSKGVPRKNIKKLAGKPLIAWTIEEAKKSKYIDRLILSTEDLEIINVAKKYGCEVPFVRPSELALDETPGIEPILHAIRIIPHYEYIVLLQPTSPLRDVTDIDIAIEKSFQNDGCSVVSVSEAEESPYWMYEIGDGNKMIPLLNVKSFPNRRQDIPKSYVLNGAVYVSSSKKLKSEKGFLEKNTLAYVMPKERSLDIDTEFDFKLCELMVSKE